MAEGTVGAGGKGSGRPRREKFLQYMAAPSPALAPARPQVPLPIPLCNAGGHRARSHPIPTGSPAPAHSQPQPPRCAGPQCKEHFGRGVQAKRRLRPCRSTSGTNPARWWDSRDGGTAGPPLQVQGRGVSLPQVEEHFPSTGLRGTTVAPVVRVLGLRSTAFFFLIHAPA